MSWNHFFELYGQDKIEHLITQAYESERTFPPKELLFSAYEITQPDTISVVILGQDPYILEGQAHGLAFSIYDENAKVPPTLKNIFKELEIEYGIKRTNTNLSDWAKQGVFLLNTILTVKEGVSLSHKHIGWQDLTVQTLQYLNQSPQPICYIMLGNDAKKYSQYIQKENACILYAPHPSPLAAYRGFFQSNIFKETNNWLESHGQKPIKWL